MGRVKEAVHALPSIDAFLDRKAFRSLKPYRRVAAIGYVAAMLLVGLLAQVVAGSDPVTPTLSNLVWFAAVLFVALSFAVACAFGAVVLYQMRVTRRASDREAGSGE